jgi:hypothetical protein
LEGGGRGLARPCGAAQSTAKREFGQLGLTPNQLEGLELPFV